MCDFTADATAKLPLLGCQAQVAASRILVALFHWLGRIHTLSDGFAIYDPGHLHILRVEVSYYTYHCGLVGANLLRGWWV